MGVLCEIVKEQVSKLIICKITCRYILYPSAVLRQTESAGWILF